MIQSQPGQSTSMYDWLCSGENTTAMNSNAGNPSAQGYTQQSANAQGPGPEIQHELHGNQSYHQTNPVFEDRFAEFDLDGTENIQLPTFDPKHLEDFLEDVVKPDLTASAQKASTQNENMASYQTHAIQAVQMMNGHHTHVPAANGYHVINQEQVKSGDTNYHRNHQIDLTARENRHASHDSHVTIHSDTMEGVQNTGSPKCQESSDHTVSYAVDGFLPQVLEPEGFVAEPLCRVKTFYVGGAWPMGGSYDTARHRFGQMYVEQLDPPRITQPHAIIFLHGDFHHGKIWQTKPDGKPGWASYFVEKGYQVFIVDLPPSGRSNFLTPIHFKQIDIERVSQAITASSVENTLTVPEEKPNYRSAALHNQWPGTGRRGDAAFDAHCDSLDTLTVPKKERQTLGQHGVSALLRKIDRKAVLIGEGAGGNVAWLAADVVPEQVAAVVAIEPTGPPFGKPAKTPNGDYNGSVARDQSVRAYGLADIPLTYDPPARAPQTLTPSDKEEVLDVVEVARHGTRAVYFMQDGADTSGRTIIRNAPYPSEVKGRVRKLIQLMKVPHTVITAEAGMHTEFDWATVAFMRQAGLTVDWFQLENCDIKGNGHLMFLEKNSDKIAELIDTWIRTKTHPEQPVSQVQTSNGATNGLAVSHQLRDTTPFVSGDGNNVAGQAQQVYQTPRASVETSGAINGAPSGAHHEAFRRSCPLTPDELIRLQQRQSAQRSNSVPNGISMTSHMNGNIQGAQNHGQYMTINANGGATNNGTHHHQMSHDTSNMHQDPMNQTHHAAPQQHYFAPAMNGAQAAAFSNQNSMT